MKTIVEIFDLKYFVCIMCIFSAFFLQTEQKRVINDADSDVGVYVFKLN